MVSRVTEIGSAERIPEQLQELLRRIRFFYDPQEVWLFGSRARGVARAGSDWDILVVVDDAAPDAVLDPTVGWRLQRGSGVHADIVCYRAAEFAAEAHVRNTLAHEVVSHGGRRLDAPAE
jgi:predicted nucleotidyltransferase